MLCVYFGSYLSTSFLPSYYCPRQHSRPYYIADNDCSISDENKKNYEFGNHLKPPQAIHNYVSLPKYKRIGIIIDAYRAYYIIRKSKTLIIQKVSKSC